MKDQDQPASKDQYAVVELMGHVRHVGRFAQVEFLGAKMGQIEELKPDGSFGMPVFFGAQSVYRITMITEEDAQSSAAPRRLLPEPDSHRQHFDFNPFGDAEEFGDAEDHDPDDDYDAQHEHDLIEEERHREQCPQCEVSIDGETAPACRFCETSICGNPDCFTKSGFCSQLCEVSKKEAEELEGELP